MGLDIFVTKVKHREIGYFRKVNFLVAFFEKKGFDVQSQAPFAFDRTVAEELLDLCNQVLADHNKAEDLLPTRAGFFFGSTEYNEYYFEDVELVRDWVKDTLIPEFDTIGENECIEFSTWW